MSEIQPAFPIGKTQWSKWGSEAREAYNRAIAKGFTFDTAVAEANATQVAPPPPAPPPPLPEEVAPPAPPTPARPAPKRAPKKKGK